MKKVCILYHESIEHMHLLDDIKKDSRCTLIKVSFKKVTGITKIIRNIHISKRVGNFLNIPYKYIWYSYKFLLKYSNDYNTILIFDGALEYTDIFFLKQIKKYNKSIRICVYLINSFDASSPVMEGVKDKLNKFSWDAIYSFDPTDCHKYGFQYLGFNYYSKLKIEYTDIYNDCYFCGGIKGDRTHLIVDTYNFLNNNNVSSSFVCKLYGSLEQMNIEGIKFISHRIPYTQVVDDINKSRCIVEILQVNQHAPSLRYFEAICYNKKLLTTNEHIKDYPFYNEKYMKIFRKVEDIDIEWLKLNENIDYHYNNEFSPARLIDFLINEVNQERIKK